MHTKQQIKASLKSASELQPVFGAYFNMARHNMFTTLQFIRNMIGLSDVNSKGEPDYEGKMFNMSLMDKNVELTPEQEVKFRSLLFLHFPFLKYLVPKKKSKGSDNTEGLAVSTNELRQKINNIVNVLNYYRDRSSHTVFNDMRDKKTIYRKQEHRVADYIFDWTTASCRIIKERYAANKNTAQKGMINDNSLKFITDERVIITRDKQTREIEAEPNKEHFLFPKNNLPADMLSDGTNPDRLSVVGLIQFLSLFLEKKYINELLLQTGFINAFSGESDGTLLTERRLIFEVFAALRIRLPQTKLSMEKTDLQVAMDMLNELKKCPSELYELLSDDDRSSFNVISSTGDQVLLTRSSDRFPQLMLSYFDTTKSFSKLRFQVNVGKLRYLFSDGKLCLDGQKRMRVIQADLNAFGRIQEVEDKRLAQKDGTDKPFGEFKVLGFDDAPRNDSDILPYISDARTSYIFDGDNLNFRLGDITINKESVVVKNNGDSLPAISEKDAPGHYSVACAQAQGKISKYELPALAFYHFLNPGEAGKITPTEKLIAKTIFNYRRLFSDVRDEKLTPLSHFKTESELDFYTKVEYGIARADVPDKIVEFLLAKPYDGKFQAYKKQLIDKMIKDAERRIKRIDADVKAVRGDDNKIGKRSFVTIKPGSLAGVIAADIVSLQDALPEKKLTGLNYAVMQGMLATLSSNGNCQMKDLRALFIKAGLLDEKGGAGSHPFLHVIVADGKVQDTVAFYKKYFQLKINYLSSPVPDDAQFLHHGRAKWGIRDKSFYISLAKRYMEQPVVLPRQLFEEPIRECLKKLSGEGAEELKKSVEAALSETGRCNAAYMVSEYMVYIRNDDPQRFYGKYSDDMKHVTNYPFYGYVRKYQNEARKIQAGLDKNSVYYGAIRYALVWAKNNPVEKSKSALNQAKLTNDEMVSLLKRSFLHMTETEKNLRRYMVQDMILFLYASRTVESHIGNNSELYLVDIEPDSNVLDYRIDEISIRREFKWNNDYFLKTLVLKDVKLKDYGDVYRYLNDNRVGALLANLHDGTISVDELHNELKSYDEKRIGIFKDILDYEVSVQKKYGKQSESFERVDFKAILSSDAENDELTKETLRRIRNAFCHNFYPDRVIENKDRKKILYEDALPGNAESIARIMDDIAGTK